jgi:hypothetical protein
VASVGGRISQLDLDVNTTTTTLDLFSKAVYSYPNRRTGPSIF